MNLSKFPIITCAKTIIFQIERQNFTSQTFFNYDAEIDGSLLKGIRFEFSIFNFIPLGSPSPYSYIVDFTQTIPVSIPSINIANLDDSIAPFFGITLVDNQNNNILQDYPLCGLNNPTIGANANTNYIRRFNAKINLQKSFITLIDKTVSSGALAGIDLLFGAITFYYKPKK
jgi:hypothetical protein